MGKNKMHGNMATRQAGFTLLELMMVVVIIGILAAIAYPNYQRQAERGRVSEGRAALVEAANRMERCFSVNGTYAGCNVADESATGIYGLEIVNADAATFLLRANRVLLPGTNQCGNLTITHTGQRGATAGDVDDCWQ